MHYTSRYDSLIQYHWENRIIPFRIDDPPSWHLIKAQVATESSFNPTAISPVGAQGLMQLMPSTAVAVGVMDPKNPEDSIRGGIVYLLRCWTIFKAEAGMERWWFAIASYNAGPGNIIKAQEFADKAGRSTMEWGSISKCLRIVTGLKSSQETIRYVDTIAQKYNEYRRIVAA